jgi:hypothetical protein
VTACVPATLSAMPRERTGASSRALSRCKTGYANVEYQHAARLIPEHRVSALGCRATSLLRSTCGGCCAKETICPPKKPAADKKKGTTVITNDPEDRKGRLKSLGGSQSDNWNSILANQTVQTLWVAHSEQETKDRQYSATAAALVGIGPKDKLEGMMAAQLIAAHNAAMECYRRAMISEQTFEGRRENLNQANKLSRTYALLLDALNRHRGKGQQKVTVEHVHVHAGGQAVVGMVETPGGGVLPKSQDQPHAKQIAHAPQPAVWSADKEREPVQISSDAKWSLPHARRNLARRSKG